MLSMARRTPKTLSEQLRATIDASEMSRYAICKVTGIHPSAMSRFMAGRVGLTLAHIEALCALLGLELIPTSQAKRPKGR